MPSRPKTKMPVSERAKQFMPFAALKGLPEALAAKEKIVVPKAELSPEALEELDERMHELCTGSMVTVIYFCRDEYLKITGMIAKIDEDARILRVVNTKIPFEDIREISKE